MISDLDIVESSRGALKGVTGGLDQSSPWTWAIAHSTGHRLAKVVARIANRSLRGHYSKGCGEVFASCRLIALYKDKKRIKVRPIGVGGALRRLITKAVTRAVRSHVDALLADSNQLGVLKDGVGCGIHAARVLAEQCKASGEVMFLNDYRNAFNTGSHLMFKLCEAHTQIKNLVNWLYTKRPHLVTSEGDVL